MSGIGKVQTKVEVKFSKRAERQLDNILGYLEAQFGNRTAEKAVRIVQNFEQRVAHSPELYPVFDTLTQTRRAVLKKRMLAFYQLREDYILITAFMTTYQNYSPENVT